MTAKFSMYAVNGEFPGRVLVIDTDNNTIIDTDPTMPGINPIPVGSNPLDIAYDPIHQDMYVTNIDNDTVSVIDTTTNTVIAEIQVGDELLGIAYDYSTPDCLSKYGNEPDCY